MFSAVSTPTATARPFSETATATAAANAVESMKAFSTALILISPPLVVERLSALLMYASTKFWMTFSAMATPTATEMEMASLPPNEIATATAPVTTSIEAESVARRVMPSARIPAALSPSMMAETLTLMALIERAPAPAAAKPNPLPPATATANAPTNALIEGADVARSSSDPPVTTMLEFWTIARTAPGWVFAMTAADLAPAASLWLVPMRFRARAAPMAMPAPPPLLPTPTATAAPITTAEIWGSKTVKLPTLSLRMIKDTPLLRSVIDHSMPVSSSGSSTSAPLSTSRMVTSRSSASEESWKSRSLTRSLRNASLNALSSA